MVDDPPNFFDEVVSDPIKIPDEPWPETEPLAPVHLNGNRPSILIVEGEIDILATHGEDALIEAKLPIFQRGRELVRPVHQEVPASRGRITISAGMAHLSLMSMVDHLSRAAIWTRWHGRLKKEVRANPSKDVAAIIASRVGQWRFPVVAGVITTPTLRPDGSVLHRPGYDPDTRLYVMHDPTLRPSYIPLEPTREDADRAIGILNALVDEFPFVSDVDRSVALSALITPVVRGAISVAPLHAIKASTAGTGKSYLADLASAIVSGRPCPVISVSPDLKETEARLTGLLLAGFPLISLDNVNGDLGGDLLCQAVERPTIRLRRLGGSDIFEIESRATFFATGNGLRVKGDMTRRTVICNLDAGVERPEMRDFVHSPVDDVLADRGLYVAACLTVVRAYIVAGRPDRCRPLASFEDWSDLVRSALVWLRMPDPVTTMEAAREEDPELNTLRDLLHGWKTALGSYDQTVRNAVDAANLRPLTDDGRPGELQWPEFRESLLAIAGVRGVIDTLRLGKWLAHREGRIVDGLRLRRGARDTHAKQVRWRVEG